MTTVARSPNMTVHEARQRLQQERNSRLTQLSAIEDGAALAHGDLATARTAAIRRVLTEITAAEHRLTGDTYGTCQGCKPAFRYQKSERGPLRLHRPTPGGPAQSVLC